MTRLGANSGHGHAWQRPDGVRMRCGGPGLCADCAVDLVLVEHAARRCPHCDHLNLVHGNDGCRFALPGGLDCPCRR